MIKSFADKARTGARRDGRQADLSADNQAIFVPGKIIPARLPDRRQIDKSTNRQIGKSENQKIGKMEKWKNGKMEKWKNGKMEKWKNRKSKRQQAGKPI
ncbi:MAG: hypothetical protein LBP95_04465 [Deltaproteobacteria bacterium]|jgi:hypothetical protein|nr:hypothetical protein [Deltaproteobacteria bacterium]